MQKIPHICNICNGKYTYAHRSQHFNSQKHQTALKVKELFGKADEIIHSKDVYKVMKVNKNNITLDNGYNYKPYELINQMI